MSALYYNEREEVRLDEVVFEPAVSEQILQFLKEHQFSEVLQTYNLPVANKILLFGKTGCGKTMTAKAIAKELNKKLYVVNLATVVSSKLGETAKNIQSIFKDTDYDSSVLFFDELDSLGQVRDYDNKDSSEMKRVVNAILQLIDHFPKNSVLIGATNQIQMIDEALVRRFELRLEFKSPTNEVLESYYDNMLLKFPEKYRKVERLYEISFSEAKDLIFQQVKKNIIAAETAKLHQNATLKN